MPYLLADQRLDKTRARPEDNGDSKYNQNDREDFSGNIERFDDLIADRAESDYGQLERIQKRPAFKDVVTECAERHQRYQCNQRQPKMLYGIGLVGHHTILNSRSYLINHIAATWAMTIIS